MKKFILFLSLMLCFTMTLQAQTWETWTTWAIWSGTVSGGSASTVCGLTANSVPFADALGCLTEDNINFNYDGTNLFVTADIEAGSFTITGFGTSNVLFVGVGGTITEDNSPTAGFSYTAASNVLHISGGLDTTVSGSATTWEYDKITVEGTSADPFQWYFNFPADPAGADNSITIGNDGTTTFSAGILIDNASPSFVLRNSTLEDIDGGRENEIRGKGLQSGGEESTLGMIKFRHDGTGNDEKGEILISTNSGAEGDSPSQTITIASTGAVDFPSSVTVSSTSTFTAGIVVGTGTGSNQVTFITPGSTIIRDNVMPILDIHNKNHEDADLGREGEIRWHGEQSGGEITTMATIEVHHDGVANDEKGEYIISVNKGSDGDSPTQRFKIEADGTTTIDGENLIFNHEGPTDDANENTLTTSNLPDADSDRTVYLHNPLNDARNMAAKIHNIMTDPRLIMQATDDPGGGTQEDYSGKGNAGTFTGSWTTTDLQLKGGGLVYQLIFDGIDDCIDYSDRDYYTFDDSGSEPVSWSGWIEVTDQAATQVIIAKWDELTANPKREYRVSLDSAEKLSLEIYDEGNNQAASLLTDAALSVGWHHFSIMYTGAGGANPLTGNVDVCIDGDCTIAFTITDNASYVNMSNQTSKLWIGASEDTASATVLFFSGSMIEIDVTGEAYSTDDIFKLRLNARGDCGE